jgi:malonyl-CoA O-methyltransferase
LSKPFPAIDRGAARGRFSRAARTYEKASRLEAEVAARMLERLDYVKLDPRRVLDAGSGPPRRLLARRYAKAEVLYLDYSLAMLSQVKSIFRKPRSICADMGSLPLADGTMDLVWSSMALHWAADPAAALREFHRVLRPNGLVMFSTLGPDTLKELRAAAGGERVHAFLDMHDLGDMLVGAGFAAPVMDMEMIEIEYRTQTLVTDLRLSGQTNARADRPRGLVGRGFAQRLREVPARATFEVVYGHAWRPEKLDENAKTIRVFKRMP